MSADNGIYILQTYGPEYRVAYCQAVDNIYGTYCVENFSYLPNPEGIVEYFGKAKVFTDLEEAWDFALALEDDIDYTEYGVSLLKEFETYTFKDFEEKVNGKSGRSGPSGIR